MSKDRFKRIGFLLAAIGAALGQILGGGSAVKPSQPPVIITTTLPVQNLPPLPALNGTDAVQQAASDVLETAEGIAEHQRKIQEQQEQGSGEKAVAVDHGRKRKKNDDEEKPEL